MQDRKDGKKRGSKKRERRMESTTKSTKDQSTLFVVYDQYTMSKVKYQGLYVTSHGSSFERRDHAGVTWRAGKSA